MLLQPSALPGCPQCPFSAGPGSRGDRAALPARGKRGSGEGNQTLQIPRSDPSASLCPKDIPVSLPIQCTEDAVTGEGQRSPESHQNHPGAPTSSASNLEGSAHPMEQPQAASRLPPSPGNGVGTGGAAASGSTEGEKGDVPTWMRTWILPVPREGGRAPCSPRGLETLNPGAGGSFPNLLDLYEAPEVLEREDAPGDGALPVEAPVEIRGPVKVTREAGGEVGPCRSCGIRDSSSSSPSAPDPREVWQSGVIALKSLWAPNFLVPRGIGHRNPLGSQDVPPVILAEALRIPWRSQLGEKFSQPPFDLPVKQL